MRIALSAAHKRRYSASTAPTRNPNEASKKDIPTAPCTTRAHQRENDALLCCVLHTQAIDVGLTDSLKSLQVEINDVVKGSQRPGPFRQ